MNLRVVRFVLAVAAALLMTASLSLARSWFRKSSTKSYAVTLDSDAKLSNGSELKAGNYTVKVPEDTQSPEVEFYDGVKLVAKEQAKVVTQSQKNEYTALELTTKGSANVLTAVDPGGLSEKLVLTGSSGQHGS
jgi:hypothetical protein